MTQYDSEDFSYLDIRDFFDAYDRHDPYMLAAVSQLNGDLRDSAPHLLKKQATWYQEWVWGGKRDLLTGLRVRNDKFIYPAK